MARVVAATSGTPSTTWNAGSPEYECSEIAYPPMVGFASSFSGSTP
ncbi:hypothetical protein ACFQV2_26125 [Actinokineospora soli]|uniref:Uncharacterized protein n=1 Tax=Actinokineospora soli TaxID=1048753 RepID=A0ABW2TSX5_9PSEU